MPIWAAMGRVDLYFLASHILTTQNAPYIQNRHPWLFDRYRMVQAQPNGCIDIWSREHYKSTAITKDLTIQDLLNDPNLTFGFFSFKAPIAKAFLRNIMYELEGNELLKKLYPEALWQHPKRESQKWSELEGIIIKRPGNPKESSIEASGLVDGQPTSKHYDVRVYDDVVTLESVSTDDQMAKVAGAYELSDNLGKEGGAERIIGTRYHRFDLYQTLMDSGAFVPRIFPCFEITGENEDGEKEYGEPVLYTREYLEAKRVKQGPFTFSAQMLCDPIAESVAGFKPSWLNYYERDPWQERQGKNVYILVDPANSRKDKTQADYTAMVVIGLGADHNYYILDIVRERLGLTQRTERLFDLVQFWQPMPGGVVYEKYGMSSDIEHIQSVMEREKGFRFEIQEVGGAVKKEDRIRRLVGPMEQSRFYFPTDIPGRDDAGNRLNMTRIFIDEELEPFPVSKHDDILDAMSRIFDVSQIWPNVRQMTERYSERRERDEEELFDWMTA